MKVDIECVEETPGQAKTILSMRNSCEEYATQEQIEEMRELLVRQRVAEVGCQKWEEKDGMNCRFIAKLQLWWLAEIVLISIIPPLPPPPLPGKAYLIAILCFLNIFTKFCLNSAIICKNM